MEENMYGRLHKSKLHRQHMPRLTEPRKLNLPCYWIWTIREGRLVVTGPKSSEQEAYNWGYAKLGDVDFKVEQLPTRDMNAAVRMLKGKLLDKTANLDMSIKRARRQV